MIVIIYKAGRLGNRLVNATPFLALALDHGSPIVNLSIDEYADAFVGPAKDVLCRFPPRESRLARSTPLRAALFYVAYRLVSVLVRLDRRGRLATVIRLDWDDELELDEGFARAARRRVVVVQGWKFQNPDGVRRHAAAVRRYFALQARDRAAITEHVRAARQGVDVLVGLHIRHGDYRTFRDYYYPLDRYREIAARIVSLLAGSSVRFLVCSDEEQDLGRLGAVDAVWGPGGAITDMYTLAACDLIAGPPSTYSAWASFYGDVPLYWIEDPAHEFTLDDFVVHDTLERRP